MSCHQVIFYILHYLITSSQGEEGKEMSRGPPPPPPMQCATQLNSGETAEGRHSLCHRCHGGASHCLVGCNQTSLALRIGFFSAINTLPVGIKVQRGNGGDKEPDAGRRTKRQTATRLCPSQALNYNLSVQ